MTVDNIDIEATLNKTREMLATNPSIDPSMRGMIEMLILIISLLCSRLKIDSTNSSIPPSQDPNRKKTPTGMKKRNPDGQKWHKGKTLQKVDKPAHIVKLSVDRTKIPKGIYKKVGHQSRQVFDFEVNVFVTEYQAEILQGADGKKYMAAFPPTVRKAVQYGAGIKANAVYMNCYQMASLARIEDHFKDQLGLPISKGSVYNFSNDAYRALESFEDWVKQALQNVRVAHGDETGVNVNGKRCWLHDLCTDKLTLFHVDEKRGQDAMNRMGVLPKFNGVLCHDHWKPYFRYDCEHSLCNAHHLRELTFAEEIENQKWAGELKELLLETNDETTRQGGKLTPKRVTEIKNRYRKILARGEIESPLPEKKEGKRGRVKKTKSRNLLERLRDFETETLLFMHERDVPFTNNQGENDLRMTKVQQKVSGCFRSMEGAQIFARVRSYINTCLKNGVRPTEALTLLFEGRMPNFIQT
jgi:transposase